MARKPAWAGEQGGSSSTASSLLGRGVEKGDRGSSTSTNSPSIMVTYREGGMRYWYYKE